MIVDKYVNKNQEMLIVYLCITLSIVFNIINSTSSLSLHLYFKKEKKYNNIWLIKSGRNWATSMNLSQKV